MGNAKNYTLGPKCLVVTTNGHIGTIAYEVESTKPLEKRWCVHFPDGTLGDFNESKLKLYSKPEENFMDFKVDFKEKFKSPDVLTCQIPEGFEFDKENSDLDKGLIKFKKTKAQTFEEIVRALYPDIVDEDGLLSDLNYTFVNGNRDDCNKLYAYTKLNIIAKYFNKDWKNGLYAHYWNIVCTHDIGSDNYKYEAKISECCNTIALGTVAFKEKKDCEKAIELMGDDLKRLF